MILDLQTLLITKQLIKAVADKTMKLYQLNKKLTVARQRGFIFNHINKLTIKNCSNLSNRNMHYYLKLRTSNIHRQFFKIISQSAE